MYLHLENCSVRQLSWVRAVGREIGERGRSSVAVGADNCSDTRDPLTKIISLHFSAVVGVCMHEADATCCSILSEIKIPLELAACEVCRDHVFTFERFFFGNARL